MFKRLHEDRLAPGAGDEVWGCELWLAPYSLSLRTYRHFEDALSRTLADPLAGILSALRPQPHDPVSVRVILSLHPARARRCLHARRIVQRLITHGGGTPVTRRAFATKAATVVFTYRKNHVSDTDLLMTLREVESQIIERSGND